MYGGAGVPFGGVGGGSPGIKEPARETDEPHEGAGALRYTSLTKQPVFVW
jgi:hypothetical protein